MNKQRRERLLRQAAIRARTWDRFMASALTRYQQEHELDDDALAGELELSAEKLTRLSLCLQPDPAAGRFREGIEQLVEYTGANMLALTRILREVQALQALDQAGLAAGPGSLAIAARDHTGEPAPEERPTHGRAVREAQSDYPSGSDAEETPENAEQQP